MAKRKTIKNGNSPSRRPGRKSWLGLLFGIAVMTPVRQLLLLILILAILFWQRPNIENGGTLLVELFGWGLLLIAIAIITIAVWILRGRLSSFFFHLHRWIGGIAFILVIWGILGFSDKGGSFGQSIISYPSPDFIGVLRLLGLTVIGIILVAPTAFFRRAARFISWMSKEFKRKPVPAPPVKEPSYRPAHGKPIITEKPALPTEMKKLLMPPEMATSKPVFGPEREVATPKPAPSSQQDLRQVAQEVWKKYGQSPDLRTVNGWRLPPIEILDSSPEIEFSEADNLQRASLIEEALASYGVEVKVVQINSGPTVTQFGIEPGWDRKFKEIKEKDENGSISVRLAEVSKTRVKVDRITSLANDMALALAAPSIRIEAPVPGKSIVGIEVPNTISSLVSLRGVVETSAFQKLQARSSLALALGKGAGGEAIAADLAKMPHLLIAGATGSGKTVCLNTIICCLLLNNTPHDVKFIMIDPKRVELTSYNSIPHLATPVIVDTNKALSALRWLTKEMDGRYQKLASAGARNIEAFNKDRHGEEKMSYLVLIIDELADLMMAGFDEVENILCRLAQLARAIGIHLIVATQRPSVDVVTGLIKANFPTRISFAVTSQVDSRTILDGGGAEKLLGKGDMLFMPTEAAKPKRLQGCFVSDAEAERLVYFWGSQQKEDAEQLKIDALLSSAAPTRDEFPKDPLLQAAKELAAEHEHISTSYLQRKLHIGYPRAARLMEQLEEELNIESEGEGEGA